MNLFFLGICGTFMGSLAILAREAGHSVRGCDAQVYPPMSTLLESQGIELLEGYDPAFLDPAPDVVIVGNAMSRGNPAVEHVLDQGLYYQSGPQWLAEYVLRDRRVLAAAGTHGKTTTASMLAWVLEHAGLNPGFLIGGVPRNFDISARLGEPPCFVIEADEYDTAFFDKRSKFVHYRPHTLILNNLEFDHADIFADLAAIQTQFHHLVRIVPGSGRILLPAGEAALEAVLERGCWTPVERMRVGESAEDWSAELLAPDGSEFRVRFAGEDHGVVRWNQTGLHSVANGLAAVAAARHAGVAAEAAVAGLSAFAGVKRRMEVIGEVDGVTLYDDFAHHPTAIRTTLQGLRARLGPDARILALIEPRSNTMRMGVHRDELADSCTDASEVIWYRSPQVTWNLDEIAASSPVPARVLPETAKIVNYVKAEARPGCHVVVMSNGGFEGIHKRLLDALREREAHA